MPYEPIPGLRIAPREGYSRGQEMFEKILWAALDVLIQDGGKAVTLRTVATRCGMKAGNLSYYFKTKEELWRSLLDAIMCSYEEASDRILQEANLSAEKRLERYVSFALDDIATKKATCIFPELWAMANHDPFVQERVDEMYQRARNIYRSLINEINPSLPLSEQEIVALFLTSTIEGSTIFVGYNKQWTSEMAAIKRLTVKSFLMTISSLKPGEIRGRVLTV